MIDNVGGGDNHRSCAPDVILGPSEEYTDLWGEKTSIIVQGESIYLFNFSAAQSQHLENALSILPPEYFEAVPRVYRVGDPSGVKTAMIPPTNRRVMGGSHICRGRHRIDPDMLRLFEFISFHPGVFDEITRYTTIFHELGHFIDSKFGVTRSLGDEERALARTYANKVYRNIPAMTVNEKEAIACGFSYFFARAYTFRREGTWRGSRVTPGRDDRYYPEWLHSVINTHFENNTSG